MRELSERIRRLAKARGAVILAHIYQRPEIQEIADFVGDSLELSRRASNTDAAEIVFCGVHFMAETAALLSPEKTVILPEREAGCPMADMAELEFVRRWKQAHPGLPLVGYVNTSAAVKAECTICCTSANAVDVVKSLGVPRVLFLPDAHLARHVASLAEGIEVIAWQGCCPTHQRIDASELMRLKQAHPGALVLAHPECAPEIVALADFVGSTAGMLRAVPSLDAAELIVATEEGILHPLRKNHPEKTFLLASRRLVCPNMKRTRLESVLRALETGGPVVSVEEPVAALARRAIQRMLEVKS